MKAVTLVFFLILGGRLLVFYHLVWYEKQDMKWPLCWCPHLKDIFFFNIKFAMLTISNCKFSSVKYIHIVVQHLTRIFHLAKPTLYSLSSNTPLPVFLALCTHYSAFSPICSSSFLLLLLILLAFLFLHRYLCCLRIETFLCLFNQYAFYSFSCLLHWQGHPVCDVT